MPGARGKRPLRPGDVVEVRSAAEILESLDENGAREHVPFMPEMLGYVGRRFTVSKRVEKICDTVNQTYQSRRMRGTVLLEDLRCDGSAHGGCQAACRLYWKEEWLRRVDDEPAVERADEGAAAELEARVRAATRVGDADDGADVRYRCQATEAFAASEPLGRYDLRQFVREVRAGNVRTPAVLRVLARGFWWKAQRALRLRGTLPLEPKPGARVDPEPLNLAPGDLVRVRSHDEIAATLDEGGARRGLMYSSEMVPYSGGTYRVQDRVTRFIDEGSGKMVHLRSDCLILEGVVCKGDRSESRWLCPREVYAWWREAWLERVEDAGPSEDSSARAS